MNIRLLVSLNHHPKYGLVTTSVWEDVRIEGNTAEWWVNGLGLVKAEQGEWVRDYSIPVNALQLPGTPLDYASVPDSTELHLEDVDLIAHLSLTEWDDTAKQAIISKFNHVGNLREYILSAIGGKLEFETSTDGGASSKITSDPHSIPNGTAKWIRATYRKSDMRVQFFLSDDGDTWEQLGEDQTSTQAGIFAGPNDLFVGTFSIGEGNMAKGEVHRIKVATVVDGPPVLDIDFNSFTVGSTSGMAATGQTVTIHQDGGPPAAIGNTTVQDPPPAGTPDSAGKEYDFLTVPSVVDATPEDRDPLPVSPYVMKQLLSAVVGGITSDPEGIPGAVRITNIVAISEANHAALPDEYPDTLFILTP